MSFMEKMWYSNVPTCHSYSTLYCKISPPLTWVICLRCCRMPHCVAVPHVPIFLLINIWDDFVSNCEQILLSTGLQAVVCASISFSPEYAQEQNRETAGHANVPFHMTMKSPAGQRESSNLQPNIWNFPLILLLANLAYCPTWQHLFT